VGLEEELPKGWIQSFLEVLEEEEQGGLEEERPM
jgi:hypothetical protein